MNFSNIRRDINVSFGQPTIIGRRLTVFNIVFGIKYDGLKEYSQDHEISIEILKEATIYCKELACQKDNYGNFCSGCVLSTLKEGLQYKKSDLKEIEINNEKYVVTKDGKNIYFGNMSEYEEDYFGRLGWVIAEDDFLKYFHS